MESFFKKNAIFIVGLPCDCKGGLHLFKLLADELCDLSQAEKKITVVKTG